MEKELQSEEGFEQIFLSNSSDSEIECIETTIEAQVHHEMGWSPCDSACSLKPPITTTLPKQHLTHPSKDKVYEILFEGKYRKRLAGSKRKRCF